MPLLDDQTIKNSNALDDFLRKQAADASVFIPKKITPSGIRITQPQPGDEGYEGFDMYSYRNMNTRELEKTLEVIGKKIKHKEAEAKAALKGPELDSWDVI
jgi:hypothetical protein